MTPKQEFEAAVRSLVTAHPRDNRKAATLEAWFERQQVSGTGSTLVTDSAMKQVGNRIQERASHMKRVMLFAYKDDLVADKLAEKLRIRITNPDDLYPAFEAAILVRASGGSITPTQLLSVAENSVTQFVRDNYPTITIEPLSRGATAGTPLDESGPGYSDLELSKDAFVPLEELKGIVSLLLRRRNVILQGPPGVGKTFMARRLAYSAIGVKDPSRLLVLQFHPTYSYEEFVEGFRPESDEGILRVVPGALRSFIENVVMERADDELCVLIIDEINRANIAAVFGEILSLLEADKRGDRHAVQSLYSRTPFFFPDNLLVIGLMNTADRSLAFVDYALRRRFGFVDLGPRFNEAFRTFLHGRGIPGDIVDRLFSAVEKVNRTIRESPLHLGRGFEIGHSYFCNCPDISRSDNPRQDAQDWVRNVIRHDLAPLIREYWFDDRETRHQVIASLWGQELAPSEERELVD
jgi:hypothetical protein